MKNDNYQLLPPFLRIKLAVDAADLVGLLASGAPPDEYDPETRAILANIDRLVSPLACTEVVCEIFTKYFGLSFTTDTVPCQELGEVIWSRVQVDEGWGAQLLSLAEQLQARIVQAVTVTPIARRRELGLDQAGLTSGAAEVADLIAHNELGLAVEHLIYMTEVAIEVKPHDKLFLEATMKRLGIQDKTARRTES